MVDRNCIPSLHRSRIRDACRSRGQPVSQQVLHRQDPCAWPPTSSRIATRPLLCWRSRTSCWIDDLCIYGNAVGTLDGVHGCRCAIWLWICRYFPFHDSAYYPFFLLSHRSRLSSSFSFQAYLLDTYALHAASALACTACIRSFAGAGFPLFIRQQLAGMTTQVSCPDYWFANGMKTNTCIAFSSRSQWTIFLYACLAVVAAPVPFALTRYGGHIRSRSKFASQH